MWKGFKRRVVFPNRHEAGEALADEMTRRHLDKPIALGIPRGGVAVAFPIAKRLACPLEVLVLKKVPVPWSPEAGLGAIALDRTLILNEPMVASLRLTPEEIEDTARKVYQEVLRRDQLYRGGRFFPDLSGRSVILVDDGLATGYTMLAAVEFVRRRGAEKIVVAAPVASDSAVTVLAPKVDELVILYVSDALTFAVADFYEDFSEMQDEEVLTLLKRAAPSGAEPQPQG
ncbi:MAG: phosphoribosyltransferase [candidate division NC10 bacterium]|nr:phosphoribosyltransferase [candidate division NC10 bacterium]